MRLSTKEFTITRGGRDDSQGDAGPDEEADARAGAKRRSAKSAASRATPGRSPRSPFLPTAAVFSPAAGRA